MSSRITHKNCERLADTINRETGSPAAAYVKDAEGHYKAQVGNYHLYRCLGVCNLVQMVNDGGGVRTILSAGTAPQLYEQMHAWLAGYRAAKDESQ